MNLYPGRIEELHEYLESRYSHKDRQATEILLACLLPETVTGRPRPWLMIETDYPSRDCTSAWFSLGGIVPARSMALPRLLRCKPAEDMIRDWLGARPGGEIGIFVESEWRRLPVHGRGATSQYRQNYEQLQNQCIRLRVEHPKGSQAIQPDRQRNEAELARLANRILDHSRRQHTPVTAKPPDSFLYWCEILQHLNPCLNDWEMLTGSLAAIAANIEILHTPGERVTHAGDGSICVGGWKAVMRLMRDSVNSATGLMVAQIAAGKRLDLDDGATRKEIRRLIMSGVVARGAYSRLSLTNHSWLELIHSSCSFDLW